MAIPPPLSRLALTARALRRAALPACAAAATLCTLAVPAAHAATSAVPAYGQVAAVGGFDKNADYGPDPATQESATTTALTAGKLVYPVGMAVNDAAGAGDTSVYVLDNTNPEILANGTGESNTTMALDYRIQRFMTNSSGVLQATPTASTSFTLTSVPATLDERAVSLAVNQSNGDVYVLIDDVPANPANETDADRIDAWTASLGPVSGLGNDSQTTGSILVPTATLQKGAANLKGDIDGESLAMVGSGPSAEVALGGNEYGGLDEADVTPIIRKFVATGSSAGDVGGTWSDTADAENPTAKDWLSFGLQAGDTAPRVILDALSANPDGSLNVTLSSQTAASLADNEPVMATVPASLASAGTLAVLPTSAIGAPDATGDLNYDITATTDFLQDPGFLEDSNILPAPSGGTAEAGTLAPSVTELSGDGTTFPAGDYAGAVVNGSGNLEAGNRHVSALSWPSESASKDPSTNAPTLDRPASLGIRVFNANGESLAMIGNQGSTGACQITGGTNGYSNNEAGSMIAIAPGSDGTLFALTQPDLVGSSADDGGNVNPAEPLAPGGDEVLEFSPGAGATCPQPSGTFSAATVSGGSVGTASSTGAVTDPAGTTLQFDASPVQLNGGAPWAYDWNVVENGTSVGHSDVTATADGTGAYARPGTTYQFKFTSAGTYTVTLALVSDFGTYEVQRTITVQAAATITPTFVASSGVTAGSPVSFDASGTTVPAGDSISDYEWNFGDNSGDDERGPTDTHVYTAAGTYSVTLTVFDAQGNSFTSTPQQVVVNPAPPVTPPAPVTTTTTPTTPTTTTPTTTTPAPKAHDTSPTSVSPAVSAAKSGAVSVKLACPAIKTACSGTVTVKTAKAVSAPGAKGKKAKKQVLTVATGTFSLTSGGRQTLQIKLSSTGRALLKADKTLKVKVVVVAHDAYGDPKTETLSLTLHAAATKKKKK